MVSIPGMIAFSLDGAKEDSDWVEMMEEAKSLNILSKTFYCSNFGIWVLILPYQVSNPVTNGSEKIFYKVFLVKTKNYNNFYHVVVSFYLG